MQGKLYIIAAGYGCESYGQTTGYNSCDPTSGTTTTTVTNSNPGGTNGALQNTGVGVMLPLAVSVFLIVAAVALFVKRKA